MIMNKCTYFLGIIAIVQWVIITHLLSQMQNNEHNNSDMLHYNSIKDLQTLFISESSSLFSDPSPITSNNHNDNNQRIDGTSSVISNNDTKSIYNMRINSFENVEKKTNKYEGVATTLMLNAPKWFQKRYSTMISNILTNTPRKNNLFIDFLILSTYITPF